MRCASTYASCNNSVRHGRHFAACETASDLYFRGSVVLTWFRGKPGTIEHSVWSCHRAARIVIRVFFYTLHRSKCCEKGNRDLSQMKSFRGPPRGLWGSTMASFHCCWCYLGGLADLGETMRMLSVFAEGSLRESREDPQGKPWDFLKFALNAFQVGPQENHGKT